MYTASITIIYTAADYTIPNLPARLRLRSVHTEQQPSEVAFVRRLCDHLLCRLDQRRRTANVSGSSRGSTQTHSAEPYTVRAAISAFAKLLGHPRRISAEATNLSSAFDLSEGMRTEMAAIMDSPPSDD